MKARKVVERKYTEAEWAEIKRALARVGVDADTVPAKLFYTDEKSRGLGEALGWAANTQFHHHQLTEATAEVDKNIAKVLHQIKKTEKCMDAILTHTPWLEYILKTGPAYADLRSAGAALNKMHRSRSHRITKQNQIHIRLTYFGFLRQIYASVTGKDGKKPTPLGASDGPFVDFLHAASRPVLGRDFLTKHAIHAFLKRNWRNAKTSNGGGGQKRGQK